MSLVELVSGQTRALVAPERGALVVGFSIGGRDLLYLDPLTFEDPTQNVRGGIPVLFPTPGRLKDDRWQWRDRSGTLPQHGFARRYPFSVVAREEAMVALRLDWTPGEGTMNADAWPWPCSLEIVYRVAGKTLRIEPEITNRGDTPMPFGIGFHPYFVVAQADKDVTRIPTHATAAFDNVQKREMRLPTREPKIALSAKEVDLHLLDHGSADGSIVRRDGSYVHLHGSPEMRRWVVWTLEDKNFVCLEPWTCAGDAINSDADQMIVLAPGERRSLRLAISLELG